MIARLSGIVIERAPGVVIVETGGVGYTVRVPATLALQLRDGDSVTLHTHFHVREDAQELFGFLDQTALLFFEQLIAVSGVGPKTALHLMALGTVLEIKSAVARGDVAFLTSVSGVGKKTAERIVVELKDAFEKEAGSVGAGWAGLEEVAQALVSLGYKTPEIQKALAELRRSPAEGGTEMQLKQALYYLQTL